MHRVSIRSGRISFVLVAGILSVALVAVLLFSTGQSPRSAAAEFMSALAKGDVDKLTDLSKVQNKSKDQIHKEWEETIKYGRSFLFYWDIVAVHPSNDTATVTLEVTNNPQMSTSYAEHRELQLVKVDGSWKVDVPQISREMFPYLPQ